MFSWLYLALPCASLRVQPSASLDATLLLRLRQTTEVAEQVLSSGGRDITRWWGNMGHSGQVGPEIALLRRLVTNQSVKTVCEIGMNAGHSAVALLEGLDTHLVEFDLLSLPYSNASRAALERAFQVVRNSSRASRKFRFRCMPIWSAGTCNLHVICGLWMVITSTVLSLI